MSLTKSKLLKLNSVAQQCVNYLNRNKGIPFTKAEDMVLEIIKESHREIQSGNIDLVIATLKMTFLDQSVEQASQDILKSLFR
jgi:hypothetical protein